MMLADKVAQMPRTDYQQRPATAFRSAAPPCGLNLIHGSGITVAPRTDWAAFCGEAVTWLGALLRGSYIAEAY